MSRPSWWESVWWEERGSDRSDSEEGEAMAPQQQERLVQSGRGTHCAQRDGRELGSEWVWRTCPKVGPGHRGCPAGGRAQRRPGE